MELIVADSSGKTLFPISDFELDMDSGWGDGVDNTFDLVVRDPSVPLPGAAWRFFADGLEIGGRVEGFELKRSAVPLRKKEIYGKSRRDASPNFDFFEIQSNWPNLVQPVKDL